MRCIFSVIVFLSCASVHAQSNLEHKAEMAGKYWGAVIMASEFKRTECGKNVSIGKKWIDVDGAKREIQAFFPFSAQGEIDSIFSKSKERQVLAQLHTDFFSKITPEKCEAAKGVFWTLFDDAVTAWQSVR